MSTWEEYLDAVQSTPPKKPVRDKVVKLFKDLNMDSPSAALGLKVSDLDGSSKMPKDDPAASALARTAVIALEQASLAQSQAAAGTADSSASMSAGRLAAAALTARPQLNYKEKLRDVGLEHLPFTHVLEQAVWERLHTEN